ncbi:MAG: hypothetical protein U1E76_18685 [Planctomycetota bacterium]
MAAAGRWSLMRRPASERPLEAAAVELQARVLLARYGVVFRRLVMREQVAPWRDLLMVCRRLEARGEIRGGRFVAGFAGEQYALPGAIPHLRAVRRAEPAPDPIVVSAADPVCLVGIVTPGERITARARTRVAYLAGVPIAVREAGTVRALTELPEATLAAAASALQRRRLPPMVRVYLGRAT